MPMVDCSTCDGAGTYTNQFGETARCYACGGSGKVHESHQPKKK